MTADSNAIHKAAAYIEDHLDEALTLDEVAARAGYSKYHFGRMFRQATGCTVHQYIRKRRLTEAARALIRTDLPVVEIALAAGYESHQSFTQAFRAVYRLSPSAFRKQRAFFPAQLPVALYAEPNPFERRCAA
ncbi:MAG: helix-turn-helix domain-containing protein [Ethanoligenens sp.]